MPTKKGGGGGASLPPPPRTTPPAPPMPKRPQLRPIAGAIPTLRSGAIRAVKAPRPPVSVPPPTEPTPSSDDLTQVGGLVPFPVEDPAPDTPLIAPPTERVQPDALSSNEPPFDLVQELPETSPRPATRTLLMPEAPARPMSVEKSEPSFPPPDAAWPNRQHAGTSDAVRMQEAMPLAPPIYARFSTTATEPPPKNVRRPPPATTEGPTPLLSGPYEAALAPGALVSRPLDSSVIVGTHRTAAPPGGASRPLGGPSPSNREASGRTTSASKGPSRAPSDAPPPPRSGAIAALPHGTVSVDPVLEHAGPPGPFGLMLFAAPLAFATMVLAALALN